MQFGTQVAVHTRQHVCIRNISRRSDLESRMEVQLPQMTEYNTPFYSHGDIILQWRGEKPRSQTDENQSRAHMPTRRNMKLHPYPRGLHVRRIPHGWAGHNSDPT
ncbi:unnamed protein product, partial [Sphacelaria rigidula]